MVALDDDAAKQAWTRNDRVSAEDRARIEAAMNKDKGNA